MHFNWNGWIHKLNKYMFMDLPDSWAVILFSHFCDVHTLPRCTAWITLLLTVHNVDSLSDESLENRKMNNCKSAIFQTVCVMVPLRGWFWYTQGSSPIQGERFQAIIKEREWLSFLWINNFSIWDSEFWRFRRIFGWKRTSYPITGHLVPK